MKTRRAVTFRLVPTPGQETILSRQAGGTRFVWNKALDLQKRQLESGIPLLSYGELCRLLTLWGRAMSTASWPRRPPSPSGMRSRSF